MSEETDLVEFSYELPTTEAKDREIQTLKQKLLIYESKQKESLHTEQQIREENKKLRQQQDMFQEQVRRISDNELRQRVRAEMSQDILDTLLDKLTARN